MSSFCQIVPDQPTRVPMAGPGMCVENEVYVVVSGLKLVLILAEFVALARPTPLHLHRVRCRGAVPRGVVERPTALGRCARTW